MITLTTTHGTFTGETIREATRAARKAEKDAKKKADNFFAKVDRATTDAQVTAYLLYSRFCRYALAPRVTKPIWEIIPTEWEQKDPIQATIKLDGKVRDICTDGSFTVSEVVQGVSRAVAFIGQRQGADAPEMRAIGIYDDVTVSVEIPGVDLSLFREWCAQKGQD